MSEKDILEIRQETAADWFKELQEKICNTLENIENSEKSFQFKEWNKEDSATKPKTDTPALKGGGRMTLLEGGAVFEKAGVNFSEVYGTFSEKFAKEIPGAEESNGKFWASGISLVIHPRSPHVPAVHMNTRMICTSKIWFGGGADLTPMYFENHKKDGDDFHQALKDCCERHKDIADYSHFKEWCDEYFFLPHRNEPRGLGGIFYDYLEDDWEETFAFTKDVGETFNTIYPEIVKRHKDKSWTEEERDHQLHRRGRYVEFNLLHDRGTRFGLMTGGNTEAILMSMPPIVKW